MRSDLEARLALLERELRDVDLQEAAGELDAATATRLRTTYRAEHDQTESELRNSTISEEKDRRRSPQRMLIGGVVLVASFVLIVVAAVGALTEDPTPAPLGSDLSQISNEAMLAVIDANQDNPQINAMRLALAERYFEELDYSSALPQFQSVLDNEPSLGEASEALARMGWMVHVSGSSDIAEGLLLRSLEANLNNAEASWFLSLLLVDTDRPCEASEILDTLQSSSAVPAESAGDVSELARIAAEACGS